MSQVLLVVRQAEGHHRGAGHIVYGLHRQNLHRQMSGSQSRTRVRQGLSYIHMAVFAQAQTKEHHSQRCCVYLVLRF